MSDRARWSNATSEAAPHSNAVAATAESLDRVARERIAAALATSGPRILVLTTGNRAGLVAAHLTWSVAPRTEVALLDTGLGFPERLPVWQRVAADLAGRLTILRPDLSVAEQEAIYGPDLWASAPGLCCWLRRGVVMQRALAGRPGWISAASRDLSALDGAGCSTWSRRLDLPEIAPIADWTGSDIDAYLRRYRLPGADLAATGGDSPACSPCTRLRPGPIGTAPIRVEPGRLLLP